MTHPPPAQPPPPPDGTSPYQPVSWEDPYAEPQYIPQYPQPYEPDPRYAQYQQPYAQYQQPYVPQAPQHPYGQYGPGYPDPYGAYGYGRRMALPPATSEPLYGWLLVAVAALSVLAAVLPWASTFGVEVPGTQGDGKLVIGCAVVVAGCGAVIGFGQGRLWASVTALVFGALIGLIGLADIIDLARIAAEVSAPESFASISVGAGLWLTLVVALLICALASVAIVRRRPVGQD